MDWSTIPSDEVIASTIENLAARNIKATLVANKEEALEKLKSILPEGASVANGSSTTLHQIGYIDYLKENDSKYYNFQSKVLAETDPQKQSDLRRQAVTADYFVASTNAVSQNGEIISADRTGSRVGAFLFGAKNLILVVGVNKITKDLDSAMQRVREFVLPLENERAQKAYGSPSKIGKWAIIEDEINPNRIQVIFIKEALGF